MEQEHTEGVVEKALAYVKDALGLAPGDKTPDVNADPCPPIIHPEGALATGEDAPVYPRDNTVKSAIERNAESARREDGE